MSETTEESPATDTSTVIISANTKRKVINPAVRFASKVPADIANNTELMTRIAQSLPGNYNFEIPKTLWRIRQTGAKRVALQMPEGLLLFATTIADILENFSENVELMIMGDVTYGACCIDDYTARALKVDLLVHYGHSCLIPVNNMPGIHILYIFVDIKIDPLHLIETIKRNFPFTKRIAFVSTIQFITTLHYVAGELKKCNYEIQTPQARPLSPGEILGCTSPKVCADAIVYLGDGRFHLESMMIANPDIDAYQYDPYTKKFTHEMYDHNEMMRTRRVAVDDAKRDAVGTFGLILGTLGRQGNAKVLDHLRNKLEDKLSKTTVNILLSEIFPDKLKLFDGIDAFVQVACPRLSIDWGSFFPKPVLTPYEAAVVMNESEIKGVYPMDFYANTSLGPWTPNHKQTPDLKGGGCCGKNCEKS